MNKAVTWANATCSSAVTKKDSVGNLLHVKTSDFVRNWRTSLSFLWGRSKGIDREKNVRNIFPYSMRRLNLDIVRILRESTQEAMKFTDFHQNVWRNGSYSLFSGCQALWPAPFSWAGCYGPFQRKWSQRCTCPPFDYIAFCQKNTATWKQL